MTNETTIVPETNESTALAITKAPDLAQWEVEYALRQQREAEAFKPNKAVLLNALALTGITHVVVSFDGCGDSGQIESVNARSGEEKMKLPEAQIEMLRILWGQAEPEREQVTIATAIETLTYDVLELVHSGWENNDGAYGEINFDVEAHTITLDYNERYTSSENYQHTF